MSDDQKPPKAPVEYRDSISTVAGVNFAQRIIEVIAVPYEQSTTVSWRGEPWTESFARGAFDGIEKRPNRIRANRDHDPRRVMGKVLRFSPSREEGLVAEVRVSNTPLGDETLALADDEVLGASIGFAALGRDQQLDKAKRTRRIMRAFLDHLAFTPAPAYEGADVLSVRSGEPAERVELPKLVTPDLDELVCWFRSWQG